MLDSVTNYECYKGLYSSLNDHNYFEIAYALERQFGEHGLYRGLPLYAFADNHDVDRVAASLSNPAHLYPLYALLFTMPGVPSIYYGSEWGIPGKKEAHSDRPLRPQLDLAEIERHAPHPDLPGYLHRLAAVRRASPALQCGDYRQLRVDRQQLAFIRQAEGEQVVVALNAADVLATLPLKLPFAGRGYLEDLLDPSARFPVQGGGAAVQVPACGARILKFSPD
jgi:glycosidase